MRALRPREVAPSHASQLGGVDFAAAMAALNAPQLIKMSTRPIPASLAWDVRLLPAKIDRAVMNITSAVSCTRYSP